MKIIIVGCGKVGRTITEQLAKEGHDLVVIDKNPKVVNEVVNSFDVMGLVGNGATYETQKDAEISKADLLISVTSSDELNILACLVAKKNGVSQTIARVRNPEYNKQIYLMRDELGISMIVNPEMDAALEISRILRFPSALKVESFRNGKAELVEYKIEEDSPLVGRTLMEISFKYQVRILICAVCRDNEVFIPKGNFILHANDKIYITSSPANLSKFFKKLKVFKSQSKDVFLIGGGRISYYLVDLLKDENISIKLFENNYNRCKELSDELENVSIIYGDGTDHNLLLEEGLKSTDALVSLTGLDEENIIISMYAKNIGVDKVITKVNRSSYSNMLDTVGLDSVITPRDITTNHIIRHVRGMNSEFGSEFRTLYRLVNNKVEALEFFIPNETSFTGIPLKKLPLKKNVLLACILRNDELIIPNGDDEIKPLDSVIIITTNTNIKDLFDVIK